MITSATDTGPGTFGWAMDHVRAGRDARRVGWPIEVTPAGAVVPGGDGTTFKLDRDDTAIWHVYRIGGEGDGPAGFGICQGWSSGVVGADNETVGDLGVDSMGYAPSEEDRAATDWQLVSEVTPEQIRMLDAHRVPHHPNAYVEEMFGDHRRLGPPADVLWWLLRAAIAVAFGTIMLLGIVLWQVGRGLIEWGL